MVVFFASHTGIFAESLDSEPQSFPYTLSAYGMSLSFGLGYGFGEGADLAKEALLETGADSSKITGNELWQIDIFAQWPISTEFDATLNIALGPLAFAVIGYNAAGEAVEGLSYSFLNLDIAALVSFNQGFRGGIIFAMAGPLLGFRLADGQVLLKSEDVTSTYTVPGDQMLNASLGGIISTGYSLQAGPGFIDLGLKIAYHYSSVQGFLTKNSVPVNVITPSISIGYSLRGKK